MPYDDAEAKQLLSECAQKYRPDETMRAAAAKALVFTELPKLNGTAGFKIAATAPGTTVTMSLGGTLGREVIVAPLRDGEIVLARAGDETHTTVGGLDFDHVTGELVGHDEDKFRLPSPGKPVQRRSALAVVVEAALNLMFK